MTKFNLPNDFHELSVQCTWGSTHSHCRVFIWRIFLLTLKTWGWFSIFLHVESTSPFSKPTMKDMSEVCHPLLHLAQRGRGLSTWSTHLGELSWGQVQKVERTLCSRGLSLSHNLLLPSLFILPPAQDIKPANPWENQSPNPGSLDLCLIWLSGRDPWTW